MLVGAGDIGVCGSSAAAATGQLLDGVNGTVFTTGDNAYPNGSEANFRDCYEPYWGRHRARTRPVAGNHEYEAGGGVPYFNYFGENAGPFGLGYYSYRAGSWHVVALNSEVPSGPGSAQMQWLRAELSGTRSQCTLAYWHRPLFSSGPHGPNASMREIWRVLYEFDADVVIAGHEHLYERFAPQDPDGRADSMRGIRQFTVGTGGAALYRPARFGAQQPGVRQRERRPEAHARRRQLSVGVPSNSRGHLQRRRFRPVSLSRTRRRNDRRTVSGRG